MENQLDYMVILLEVLVLVDYIIHMKLIMEVVLMLTLPPNTYTRDAVWEQTTDGTLREWRSYGYLMDKVAPGGLQCSAIFYSLTSHHWYFATS